MGKGFDIGSLLGRAQALQEELASAQEDVARIVVEGKAGGGMVTVEMNGRLEVVRVMLDPSLLDDPDREMLQDLIVAATNDAIRKAQAVVADEMGKVTGRLGLKLQGLGS